MKKILGILGLLVFVCIVSAIIQPNFLSAYNIQNLIRWTSLFGIISIGVAFVIITGGIDLSIGSVVGLIGCLLPMGLVGHGWPIWFVLLASMGVALGIGLIHGLLITKMKLQPFVVTLCGLLIYRGAARWITGDQTMGFGIGFDEGLRKLATGKPCSVATFMLICGVLLGGWSLFCSLRKRIVKPDRYNGQFIWLCLAAGIAMVMIGSSRFWHGIIQPADVEFHGNLLANTFRWHTDTNVPLRGAQLPGTLMTYVGFLAIPSILWFLVVALKEDWRRIGPPTIAVIIGILCGAAAIAIADTALVLWAKIACVFSLVGILFGSIIWFSHIGLSLGGSSSRLPLVLTFIATVSWVFGQTPIVQTLLPSPFFVLLALAIMASAFLNMTIYGRYLLALGRNEEASRYSGINTDRMVIFAYLICSGTAGIGGILFALDINSVQPSGHGSFYELYAIAAAVLGGCSLRGGEGSILGVVIGAAVIRVLYNAINIIGIPTQLEFSIIGIVLLAGILADEIVKRVTTKRRDLEEDRILITRQMTNTADSKII